MENARIARAFEELADLLELAGENPFKLRAYRAFAETASGMKESIAEIAARGELSALEGVGKAIAGKVDELIATGTCNALEKARAEVPRTLTELLKVRGLGAKTVRTLWRDAGITTLRELADACEEDRLAKLPGFGKKKQEKALEAARAILETAGQMLLATARVVGAEIARIAKSAGAEEATLVGDSSRGLAIVREAIVLVRSGDQAKMIEELARSPMFASANVTRTNAREVTIALEPRIRARVEIVPKDEWIRAVMEATADDVHLAWLAEKAGSRDALLALCARSKSEDAVYRALGLEPVPRELREGASPKVPRDLLAEDGLRGIFHVHTDWSDGTASIIDMARAAADAGFAYIGISDHSRAASYANGLDGARLDEQAKQIKEARAAVKGIAILHGVEVDIMDDGSLDLDDDALASLDFVIASVHTHLSMDVPTMTARIVRAVSHPLVTILGHPTGRLLLARKGYSFDIEEVATAAAANDTYLEINANPQRLDLSDDLVRRASAKGARFVIDPDAHSTHGVQDAWLGVAIARRAALSSSAVLNAADRKSALTTLDLRKHSALARLRPR